MRAAADAFESWRLNSWNERIAILRKAADLIEQRVYDIAAVISLEVGCSGGGADRGRARSGKYGRFEGSRGNSLGGTLARRMLTRRRHSGRRVQLSQWHGHRGRRVAHSA